MFGIPHVLILLIRSNCADDVTMQAKSFRIVTGSGSGSSSEAYDAQSSAAGPASSHITGGQGGAVAVSTSLKRKREPDMLSPVDQVLPVAAARHLVPPLNPTHPPRANSFHADNSPAKKMRGLFTLRRVVDRKLESQSGDVEVGPQVKVVNKELRDVRRQETHDDSNAFSGLPPKSTSADASSPPTSDAPSGSLREPQDKPLSPDTSTIPFETEGASGTVRRTSRLRKPAQPVSSMDVFGSPDVRPLQPRRKAHTSTQPDTSGFSGMSAVALKALTSSNTAKNQKYLAAKLETEVIRKEGARPDSPMVKVRTVSQREKEEKSKQRKERAERRARRIEDGSGSLSDTDRQSDHEDSSLIADDWDGSQCDLYPRKHRRGPGDDEDYETPEKWDRPTKRPKFSDGEAEREGKKKQVKWDRGLSTMIYLDEVQLGARSYQNQDIIKKGCLTQTAKVSSNAEFSCLTCNQFYTDTPFGYPWEPPRCKCSSD